MIANQKRGGKVVVATGSGPNLHEGITTLFAELMSKGVIDGVLTSSAVIAHEMTATLDKVKRVDGRQVDFGGDLLPKGFTFELTELSETALATLRHEMKLDDGLIARCRQVDGKVIIKAEHLPGFAERYGILWLRNRGYLASGKLLLCASLFPMGQSTRKNITMRRVQP